MRRVDVWNNEKSVIAIQMTTVKKAIETANHANAIITGGRDWKSALATNVGGSAIASTKRQKREVLPLRSMYKATNSRMLKRNEAKTAMSIRGIIFIQC
jgi:hypothetical protein